MEYETPCSIPEALINSKEVFIQKLLVKLRGIGPYAKIPMCCHVRKKKIRF